MREVPFVDVTFSASRINGTDAENDDVVRKGYEGFGDDVPATHPSVLGDVRLARPLKTDRVALPSGLVAIG